MKLLSEAVKDAFFSRDGTHLYLEAIYLQGEIRNGNDRIYPIGILTSAVSQYQTEFIDTRRACGELNHPDHPQINFERACIRTISLVQDGNNFIGKALVLDTPLGLLVQSLHKGDVNIGVSSRGLASVVEQRDGSELIQDDFYICAAADVVSDPSAPDAFVKGVMERKEWLVENGIIREKRLREVNEIANLSVKKKVTKEDFARLARKIMKVIG